MKLKTTLQEHQQLLYQMLLEFDRVCAILNVKYFLFAGTMLGAVRHRDFIPWDDDLDVMMFRDDYERFLSYANEILNQEKYFLQKEFSEHYPMFFSKLRMNGTTCLEKYHPKDKKSHQGIYIDIFPCDNAYTSKLGQKIQFYCSKVVIAKSLDRRGYETDNRKKKLFIMLCKIVPLTPFLKITKNMSLKKRTAFVHSFLGAASSFEKNVYLRADLEELCWIGFGKQEFPVPKDYNKILTILYGDYMKLPPIEERKAKEHAILVDLHRSYEFYETYRDGMVFDGYTRSIR